MVIAGVHWRTYFRQILPAGANGITVILSNTCNQDYTYQVDGAEAKFIGRGRHHNAKYEYLGKGIDLSQTLELNARDGDNIGGCRYHVNVYPSEDFENIYVNDMPLLYTISLASVFLFTSAVFLLYDYYVERRQTLVMSEATKSGTLVSSLFPEVVRGRLYEEQATKKAAEGKDQFLEGGERPNTAIANLYPECTVSMTPFYVHANP